MASDVRDLFVSDAEAMGSQAGRIVFAPDGKLFMAIGTMTMFVYYATVYAAIQDVIEPSLRGTAMALYFFAMYVLGASLGPLGMGVLSSYFTRVAAVAALITSLSVPEYAGSQTLAFAEGFDSRGSITMSVAPLAWPSMMRCACGLK